MTLDVCPDIPEIIKIPNIPNIPDIPTIDEIPTFIQMKVPKRYDTWCLL